MISANKIRVKIILIFLLPIILILSSCQGSRLIDQEKSEIIFRRNEKGISTEYLADLDTEDHPLYYFDYQRIDIDATSGIDIKIKSCNLYLDIYGDLIILGEIENSSFINKTDIEITFDFYDRYGEKIISETTPGLSTYLGGHVSMPFFFYLKDREKYIDIHRVKVGINYKNFFERFKGNPVVKGENFYYQDDKLVIEGKVINLGKKRVENLKVLATFYNEKEKVVFIKQGYLPRQELDPLEEQDFILKVLLDEYLKSFTNYNIEVFFEESLHNFTEQALNSGILAFGSKAGLVNLFAGESA